MSPICFVLLWGPLFGKAALRVGASDEIVFSNFCDPESGSIFWAGKLVIFELLIGTTKEIKVSIYAEI